ncbi:unnamed protein product [Peniophora sp. CBMAI 1063]|nr:unnamed protein product [Peniophora sp. CBMAI 1063]
MFSTNLVALHVPCDGPARWTHAPVVHFNMDDGMTMVVWRQFWEDRAETTSVTLPNGRKYLVVTPYDRESYQVCNAVEQRLGFTWCGELLVFACSVSNGLLVNMRTWKEDRDRAWEVIRRFIVGDVDGDMEVSEGYSDHLIELDPPSSEWDGTTDNEDMVAEMDEQDSESDGTRS